MASRFYSCLCGRYATINMFNWITGEKEIVCRCGRELRVRDSFFRFSLATAHLAWARYMRKELGVKENRMDEV